ncbi:MAG: A24 family peptidase, partial [Acidobacteriota bacterium]
MSSLTPLFFATTAGAALAGAFVGHGVRRSVPWLLRLRDRRRPFAHPWMEAVTALAFVAVVVRFGLAPPTAGLLLFVVVLVAITAADYRAKLIPDRLSLGGTLTGLIYAAWVPERLLATPLHVWGLDLAGLPTSGPWAGLAIAGAGALFGFLVLEAIRLGFGVIVGTEVMGMGDSKLAMLIGAFLGPVGLLGAVLLSFFLGVVHGAIVLHFSGQPHSPFGPPLAAAALA